MHIKGTILSFFWAPKLTFMNCYISKVIFALKIVPLNFRFETLWSVFWFIQLDKSLSQNIASNFWIIYLISTNQMSRLPNSLRPVFKSMLLSRSFKAIRLFWLAESSNSSALIWNLFQVHYRRYWNSCTKFN